MQNPGVARGVGRMSVPADSAQVETGAADQRRDIRCSPESIGAAAGAKIPQEIQRKANCASQYAILLCFASR